MEIDVKQDCADVDWKKVSETLKSVGMAYYEPEIHRRAFEASHTTVFIYHGDRLIGFGRQFGIGAYRAAVIDCASPEYQGKRIGKTIMDHILSGVFHCNVILYASPGKEGFYQKHGFRKMKTGMAHFKKSAAMKEGGFTE